MFATWIPADGRFAFSLSAGAHQLTQGQYMALLIAESSGITLSPDSATGFPVAVESVANPVQTLYEMKVLIVNDACEKQITGGFWSSALGQPHQYSSQMDDQLNLTGVILLGLDTLYACRDELGAKEFRPHTFAQIRRVGDDFTLFKLQLLQKANVLKQQLDQALAAADLAVLEAVTWESEQ